MLIEFCCPVCQAPLAIQKKAVGGQVNCPKCQKLILLPSESPLPRTEEDKPPYSPGQTRKVEDVTKAIQVSVEPYRRDLENKSDLLNDAVEMIKIRNERIKEIESLILETQRDLWALEVEMDERRESQNKTRSQLKDLRQELRGTREGGTAQDDEIRTLRETNQQLENRCTELEEKKDKLKLRLGNMIEHAEHLEQELKTYRGWIGGEDGVLKDIEAFTTTLDTHLEQIPSQTEDLEIAKAYLQRCTRELDQMHKDLEERERQRSDLEQLVHSSGQDMQNALDDRKQWRNQALNLEKRLEEIETRHRQQEVTLQQQVAEGQESIRTLQMENRESRKIVTEREDDLRQAQAAQKELEESLELHRARSKEQEQVQKKQIEEVRQSSRKEMEAGMEALNRKLVDMQAELNETESRLDDALDTQHKLTEQNLQGEKERKELKKKLRDALNPANG